MGNWKRGGHSPPRFFLCRKGRALENLYICHISEPYVDYLHSFDYRVPFNKGQRRPYVGVVLRIDSYQYFVPMESPRPNHAKIRPGKHIMKLSGGSLGLLGFNNMLPVPPSEIIPYDISAEPDRKYKNLLLNQIDFCNRQKAAIFDHARQTYSAVVSSGNAFLARICCDFKALERACTDYHERLD